MKKLFSVLCLGILLVITGCEIITGTYKEGTYFGYAYDADYDAYATTVIYVDAAGMIKSVFIDTTYINESKSVTTVSTKRIEGEDYNMKTYYPTAVGEWYEQAEALEKYIIDNQGFDVMLDENGKTDAISGATINIAPIYESVHNALEQAK